RRFWKRLQFSWNDFHCVVHDNVDTPAFLDDRFDELIDVGRLGNVGSNREALGAEPGGFLCRSLGCRRIDVVDDDMGAFARIRQTNIAADTAAAAGDQCHLVLQSHGVPPGCVEICRKNHAKSVRRARQEPIWPRNWRLPMPSWALKESFPAALPPLTDKWP